MQDLNIIFAIPGMPFDGNTIKEKSLGGSETAAYYMARCLAKLGHQVMMFSNCERPGIYEGVNYQPFNDALEYITKVPHDVTVVQRMPSIFANRTASRLNILWNHDLALARQENEFKGVLWNVDKVFLLSKFMAEQYKEVHGCGEEIVYVTRNGIDLEMFGGESPGPRDRKKLMYAARPERGLDVLLKDIFPALLEKDPEFRLYLCGYKNTVDHMKPFYKYIDGLIAQLQDKVVWLGYLNKNELYKHYRTAGLYLYPTPGNLQPEFREISCITAMECQAAGLPVVSSKIGALPETLHQDAGVLMDESPQDSTYKDSFVSAVLRLTQDELAWKRASNAGLEHARQLDWSLVAEDWSEKFYSWIVAMNDSPRRLAIHFLKHSDIMAVDELAKKHDIADLPDLSAWAFRSSQDQLKTQYETIGVGHSDVFEQSQHEPRFQLLKTWLHNHKDIHRVLDFGCAHGSYSLGLAAATNMEFLGIDVAQSSVDKAYEFKAKYACEAMAEFLAGDEDVDLSAYPKFDCLILGEVLEHVREPSLALEKLERWIKHGGYVVGSVPYGPWEYMSYETYPHRAHLWEFDHHDLKDLFGKKKNVSIWTVNYGICQELGEPIGWNIFEYTVNGAPTGRIDMERKLKLQRPKQTVSASIIAGNGSEDTLSWCLKSLKHVVDEIVIADCGMGGLAKTIAKECGARIIDGVDPRLEGFETPRNHTLPHLKMDWVLWIDTDEKLINSLGVSKYIRENIENGYGIRQHHFACDTSFKPDMPVRLFRNRPMNGKSMRWYGMIHEHPELGLNEGPGPVVVLSDVHIAHVGYLIEGTRRQRFARNWPLLQKDMEKYPDRKLQKHFVCRDLMLLTTYDLQQNGGKVTEEIIQRCNMIVDLYRKHFLGQGKFCGTDTLQYYSQAMKLLGEGFEVSYCVTAGKDGAQPGEMQVARVASIEEAEAELRIKLREAVGNLTAKYW